MGNAHLQEVDTLIDRFTKTVDILMATLNYVDSLDFVERDYCEETFYQIAPCYLYMYSVVVKEKVPNAYSKPDAQLEMFDQIKEIARINAIAFKQMRTRFDDLDDYGKGFYALLETYLLMYYAYVNGLPGK